MPLLTGSGALDGASGYVARAWIPPLLLLLVLHQLCANRTAELCLPGVIGIDESNCTFSSLTEHCR